jgi:hypothetical protein
MKRLVVGSWALLAAVSMVHAQLSVPQLGVARFFDGSVHPIRGVAANLIVDSRTIATADGASFSDSAGLTSSNGLIRLISPNGTVLGEYPSGEAQPVLNVDTGAQTAAAWLPSRHILLRWDGAQFLETPIDDSSFSGGVTFVSVPSNKLAQFFVTRTDSSVAQISVALPSGRVTSSDLQPGALGRVFTQQGWVLMQDSWGLVAERTGGNRQTIQLSQQALPPNDLTMERMSNHWLHVSSRSKGTDWALYLDSTKLNISLLPPPVAEAAR